MTTIFVSINSDGLTFHPQQKVIRPDTPNKIFIQCDPKEFSQYEAVATLLTGSLIGGAKFVSAITGKIIKSIPKVEK